MSSKEISNFELEKNSQISMMSKDAELENLSRTWMTKSGIYKYTYNFSWLGRPIIQFPQDILAMQELIWDVKPDLIIETGIAHGGSLIFSASMLELNASCGGPNNAKVLGIDIDIREHNKTAIDSHPMSKRIKMLQGSSIDPDLVENVYSIARNYNRILVCLDSNHTHEHVLAELEAYAPLVAVGSYCVVLDTAIEDDPEPATKNRPWGHGNSPKTAVWEYLKSHPEFEIVTSIPQKLLITVAPDGFLRRMS